MRKTSHMEKRARPLLTSSCVGVVFSVAWYFVNRASKFWQENWEKHVDLLEDAVMGPIYKTVLKDDDLGFWTWGAYPFSVSRINQILSLFVVLLFLLLALTTGWKYFSFGCHPDLFATAVVLLTVGAVVTLCWKGQTTGGETRTQEADRRSRADRRTQEIVS